MNRLILKVKKRTFPYSYTFVVFVVCFLMTPLIIRADPSPCTEKKIIGQSCWVYVEELELTFLARIDTGATSTSIHAFDFMIEEGSDDPRENIGKIINFLTETRKGEYKRLKAEIVTVQSVVNAQGREKRYMVRLTFTFNGIKKTVLANLRDRSRMKYKLLLGRDWLSNDFLVDVNLEEEFIVDEGEEE